MCLNTASDGYVVGLSLEDVVHDIVVEDSVLDLEKGRVVQEQVLLLVCGSAEPGRGVIRVALPRRRVQETQ